MISKGIVQIGPQTPQLRFVGSPGVPDQVHGDGLRQKGAFDELSGHLAPTTAGCSKDGDVHARRLGAGSPVPASDTGIGRILCA